MNKQKLGTSQSATILNDSAAQQNRFNVSPILERKQNKPLSDKVLAFEEDRIKKINSVYNKQLIAKKMNKIMNERAREGDLNKGLLGSADFKCDSNYGIIASTDDTVEIKKIIKNLNLEGTLPKVKKFDEDLKFTKYGQQFNNIPSTEQKSQISMMSNPYGRINYFLSFVSNKLNTQRIEKKIRCQSSTFIPCHKDDYLQQFQKDLQKQQLKQKKSYHSSNNVKKGDQFNIKNNFKEIVALSEEETKLYGSRCPQGYEKIEILGKGGFSVVWLCINAKTQKKVAVKQIVNKNNQESIQRELKLLQNFYNDNGQPKAQYQNDLRLKNLIGLVEIIKDSKDTWIIFELGGATSAKLFYSLNGDFHNNERIYKIDFQQSYYDFIQLENNLLAQFIQKVASALSLLSENKLVHCDIKPENILVNYKSEGNQKFNLEQVALIDFGSVVSYHEKGTINLATIEYMPPEVINQIINENNHTKNNKHTMIQNLQGYLDTIDVWSFGASLLELLTGLPQWLSYKCRVQYQEKAVIKTGIFSIRNQDYEKLLQKQKAINEILPSYLANILSQFDNQEKGELLLDLIIQMLKFNPQERIKSFEILKHPFINSKCSQSQIDKCRANVEEMLNKENNQNLGQQPENPNQFKNLLNQNKENLTPQQSINTGINNSKSRSQSLENIPDSAKYYYDKKFVIRSLNKNSINDLSQIIKNERNKSSLFINQDFQIKQFENSLFSPNPSIQEIETSHIQQNQFFPEKLTN